MHPDSYGQKVKLSIFTGVLIAVTSIFLCCSFFWDTWLEPDYEKIADEITHKTAKKFKDEKRLLLIGTGGGMMNDIKMMAMDFHYYKEVDYDTARKLLVYCVEEYLSAINSSEKVRPYLHNYPFTAKNIEITIYFYGPDRRDLPIGTISIASVTDGTVEYQADNPNGLTLDTLRTETYEQALEIVAKEKSEGKDAF